LVWFLICGIGNNPVGPAPDNPDGYEGVKLEMDLVVYIPAKDRAGRRLQNLVGHLDWLGTIEIFPTLKQIASRLLNPTGERVIVLLLPATRQELHDLVKLGVLLKTFRLILILPDGEEETIAQGHRLQPRYVSFREGDLSDVILVLQKMQQADFPSPYLVRGQLPPLKGAPTRRTLFPARKEQNGMGER
jgi:hypothetical protein